jgi:1-hydroxy-2-isopentenylcarotenoid 3,4-desaturase
MKCIVIGGGFGGLSLAADLAHTGWDVVLLEKNDLTGGRARVWREGGFNFDMGPSWYLMPEVFDRFFERMETKRENYYQLEELTTYYKVFFEGEPEVKITNNFNNTVEVFNSLEPRGGEKLKKYLEQAKYKYNIAMRDFLYKEYTSIFQFFNRRVMTEGLKLDLFKKIDTFVSKYFSSTRAKQILEYAMVFLGTAPKDAPALYSIMSHVDLNLGVWYPRGGLAAAAEGIKALATELGVAIQTGAPVDRILVDEGKAVGVECNGETISADAVVAACDYHHAETDLLEKQHRTYSDRYWNKKVVAPSMFLIYLGLGRRLSTLEHHNLYFMKDWTRHFHRIFEEPSWPENPCFYLSCNSKTDPSSAPEGSENVFILIPVAPGLEDSDAFRVHYADTVIRHVEEITGEDLHSHIKVKRIYSQRDFSADYNALGGTALGLAHNLFQTAIFRPSHRSKKVKDLYYTGQYTHPGVGVPMTMIASEVVAREIRKDFS